MWRAIGLVCLGVLLARAPARGQDVSGVSDLGAPESAPLLFKARPLTVEVVGLVAPQAWSTITDVEVGDFNGDGRTDIAVSWYVTAVPDSPGNQRKLTLFYAAKATDFVRGAEFDLYIPNAVPALSVFRNGPSDIGVGDFDGDGDADLAVTAFFGDELWVIENLGGGQFTQHLKYPFGYNTMSMLTPPELLAADFDQDGRDELVYLVDPNQHVQGDIIHFWKTESNLASLHRVYWEGISSVTTKFTRSLAIADFNADGRPDLCFTGTTDDYETQPLLTFWYGLNPGSGQFSVHVEYPQLVCSDVVAVQTDAGCPPGVVLTDKHGTAIEYWVHDCGGSMGFSQAAIVSGYAGLSPDRGMAATLADVDGDGDLDVVTKQRLGVLTDRDQVEITRWDAPSVSWVRAVPNPVSSVGFWNDPYNQILRPRNVAVADLFGNTLPEVIAGFGPSPQSSGGGGGDGVELTGTLLGLRFAVWANSCVGDANRDGRTDGADFWVVFAALGSCQGDPTFNPDADFDKSGCVDINDLLIYGSDSGCQYDALRTSWGGEPQAGESPGSRAAP